MNCIWCKNKVIENAREHIFPEALGCPENFILENGEVCKNCNSNLGHIDQAVIDDFDILVFQNDIPRKNNKKPIINNRGNLLGKHTEEGKSIFINMENYAVESPFGDKISSSKGQKRNVNATFSVKGKKAKIKFQITIGESQKFVRGIYKIAFESLVFRLGIEEANKSKYDIIRDYVLNGIGKRKILINFVDDAEYKNTLYNHWETEFNDYVFVFRLGYFDFTVDLSEKMYAIQDIENEIEKNKLSNMYTVIFK